MDGVQGLARYIANTIQKNTQTSNTYRGRISGSTISIDGMHYPYTVAVDVPAADGDYVWCILNRTKTLAVVIGA